MAGARTAISKRRPAGPSVLGHGDLPSSLLWIFPLFLIYEVGVLFSPTVNGVDFVTRWVLAAVDGDRRSYLVVHGVLALGFLAYLLYLRRTRALRLRGLPPMLLESALYALTLGTFIMFVMERLLWFALALGRTGQHVVMSVGAGVHEELVFRLGLMGGGAALLRALRVSPGWAMFIALAVSSLVFSAAHHIGPYGDAWQAQVFTYRALAGAIFGLICYYRSLAHAVYAHCFYDLYVFLLRS